ncbi:MAG TPA: NAD(+) diphosphatase [Xanthobacteraceae bacterium]|nr:NAD(+) diphosphatase [Xanthobacteraceae bacterium]
MSSPPPLTSSLGPWPNLANTGSPLDRVSERRRDQAFIASTLSHADARAVLIGGETIVLAQAEGNDPFIPLASAHKIAEIGESIFIGTIEGAARLGFAISPDDAERLKERTDLLVTDLRTIAMRGLIAPQHLQPVAIAKALLTWHSRHRFCSNCGQPTQVTEQGWRRDCSTCNAQHFPRTDPCVIMLAIDGERCLLGRSARFPAGMYSCLAGFVEPGESLEEATRRETYEEAGIRVGRVGYFASQPWPYPMSLMIGCFAQAETRDLNIDRNELEDALWVTREEAALMLSRQHPGSLFTPPPMAVAHHIIRAYVERGPDVLR